MVNQPSVDTVEINAKFEKAKKQNGLIEKVADFVKGKTNIGYSSSKIQKMIDEGKSGDEIKKEIAKYRNSQENVAQATGDVLSVLAAMGLFSIVKIKVF